MQIDKSNKKGVQTNHLFADWVGTSFGCELFG